MMNLKSLENQGHLINKMTDREAMGLPNSFTELKLDFSNEILLSLLNKSQSELVKIIEIEFESLEVRYSAGVILSLTIDPRINTFNPTMILIPDADVEIGTEIKDVDSIVVELKDCGIKKEWIVKETPIFKTRLKSFYLAKYPVTNYEYYVFLKDNPNAEIPSSWEFGKFPNMKSNHPVYTIRPETADEYCRWLSSRTGRKFRLPSENEWEYAATGGNPKNEYPWGNSYKKDAANTIEEFILDTTPVGIFPKGKSYFGIYDMAGNVEEYVSNDYKPYDENDRNLIEDDLFKANNENYRVARGGSFTRFRDLARCKRRHGYYPRNLYVMGFRIAEDKGEKK